MALPVAAVLGGLAPTTIRLAGGLTKPLFVTHAPGDFQRIFIVEQAGRIRILRNGQLLALPFLNVDPIALGSGEQGLLGLAFHPDYSTNGRFFINYVNNSGNTQIAEYAVSANPDIADTTAIPILTIPHPSYQNHYAGWMGFGPDGYLYIATGDGGWDLLSGPDPANNAQDITGNLLGKILRIGIDGDDFPADSTRNYGIPPDNPFVGVTGDDEIWAFGLRNPWRNTFDSATGDLYVVDVGHSNWEEVNFEVSGSPGGRNYGWKCMEGMHCTTYGGCTCPSAGITAPIHEYGHTGANCSITGGEVYRGCAVPELDGHYFFADFCSHEIWSLTHDGSIVTDLQTRTIAFDPGPSASITSISSFGRDAAGELYICDLNGGEVFKVVSGTPITIVPADPFGLIDARRPFNPEDGLPVGRQETQVTFSGPVNCLTPLDFLVTQQGAAGAAPYVTEVQPINENEVRLLLSGPMADKAWTTFSYPAGGTSTRVGLLPGDVNGDADTGQADLEALIIFLSGEGPPLSDRFTDINRSNATTPADLLEEIDLLVGAGDYQPYDGASLP